jgi:hypothetical protein
MCGLWTLLLMRDERKNCVLFQLMFRLVILVGILSGQSNALTPWVIYIAGQFTSYLGDSLNLENTTDRNNQYVKLEHA